jgi:hypothetical protein
MVIMTNTTTDRPEQLTLLAPAELPVQFRLDEATRRRGLAHVNQIREQLEQAKARRQTAAVGRQRATRPSGRPLAHSRPQAA